MKIKISKDIYILLSFVSVFLLSTVMGLSDFDFIQQSILGKLIIQNNNFYGYKELVWGTKDVVRYLDHEWLCSILFYGLTYLFGDVYSIIVFKLLIEVVAGIVLYLFINQIIDYKVITALTYIEILFITFCLSFILIKPRSYSISFVLYLILLLLLEKRKNNTINIKLFNISIILLVIFWNNIHSSSIFIILVTVGIYWLIYWRDRKTILLGCICLLALLINPYGYKLPIFNLYHVFNISEKTLLTEWVGINLKTVPGVMICCILIITLLHLINNIKLKNNLVYIILFFTFFVLVVSAVRHFLYLYSICIAIISNNQLDIKKFKDVNLIKSISVYVCILSIIILGVFSLRFNNLKDRYTYNYITPDLKEILVNTNIINDGLFDGNINVWGIGLKGFQSFAYPSIQERQKACYILEKTGSDKQIKSIIEYYELNKFLTFKYYKSDTGYILNTNIYDYCITRPDEYKLLYDDDKVVYFIEK